MRTIQKRKSYIIRVVFPNVAHGVPEICTLYTAATSVVNLHILNICSTQSIHFQHSNMCTLNPFHNFWSGLCSAFIYHVADNLWISSNKELISFRHKRYPEVQDCPI